MSDPATAMALDRVVDASVQKSLEDLLERFPETLTKEEQERKERFLTRLGDVGQSAVSSYYWRSLIAVSLYNIRLEEDWKLLINEEIVDDKSGEIVVKYFRRWGDFRIVLASALPVSLGTIGEYLRLAKLYAEGLQLEIGHFPNQVGVITVKHMDDMVTYPSRPSRPMWMDIKPSTAKFAQILEEYYPGKPVHKQIRNYYLEFVAHDLEDPGAFNKDPRELADLADQMLGRSSCHPTVVLDEAYRVIGYNLQLKYPDTEEDGQARTGDIEDYLLLYEDEDVPDPVRTWVANKFNLR